MGRSLLKAIVICMLLAPIPAPNNSTLFSTPKKTVVNKKFWSSTTKPTNTRITRSTSKSAELPSKRPKFVSGHTESGNPIYTEVRVLSEEMVKQIEDLIVEEDTAEFVKARTLGNQTSTSTLMEGMVDEIISE